MKMKAKRAIEAAMQDRGGFHPDIQVPRTINGVKPKLVSVRDNIITVQESKPIEFLIQVMQTGMLPQYIVNEDGEVKEQVTYVNPKDRVNIAKFLAAKLMPSMQLVKVVRTDDDEEAPVEPKGFDALVHRAIERGRQTS